MPCHGFDRQRAWTTSHDMNGIFRADSEAASATGSRILAEIKADEPLRAEQAPLFATVRDATGRVVYTAALNITGIWLRVPLTTPATRLFI
jgi:hypothetical protein